MKFIKLVSEQGEKNNNSFKSLVFDDSMLPKTGRYNEKVSRMFDHVSKRCLLGYKLLVMGCWDKA
ncbi:MAG: hypothetical protein R6U04_00265 [Bacteroidales bacterium]